MAYDLHCNSCPYFQQRHLLGAFQTGRNFPPVELESHGSSTLLVFQAPGDIEWAVGKAIQPTKKPGGTAGVRILNSWCRKGRTREDFDIINAVQCFPGNNGDRDFKPLSDAQVCCAKRLNGILEQGTYREIIAFGGVAFETVNSLLCGSDISSKLIQVAHPNSGIPNSTLDSLW